MGTGTDRRELYLLLNCIRIESCDMNTTTKCRTSVLQATAGLRCGSQIGRNCPAAPEHDRRNLTACRMGDQHDLKELLRSILADGAFGMTLRSDELPIVHTPKGPLAVAGSKPNRDEIEAFVRQLIGSRGARDFREQGITRFMVPFEHGVRVIGAARRESHGIHIEIRRMAGSGSNKLY